MPKGMTIEAGLRAFAEMVTIKMSQSTRGEPEDQLRAPLENFMSAAASALSMKIVCTGETTLAGGLGKPDYAVHVNKLLAGYIELKSPGLGARPDRFSGRNREQWKRFQSIPNLIYSDGNEWGLYREGKLADKVVRLSGSVTTDGKKAVAADDARDLEHLLRNFLSWHPIIPFDSRRKIDLKAFAAMLAPLCRMLREDVTDALEEGRSALVALANDWRQLLFPGASNEQFADGYAQTTTFALLLGRSEGADPLTLAKAETALASHHSLLSRALQILTDAKAQAEISASLDLLLRVIGEVPPATMSGPEDPWLYFYEDFLAAYDPKLRKDAGVYYTPVEVVRAQVRLIDRLLTGHLGKSLSYADPGVITLDPAVGTGTYLLGIIDHTLGKVETEQGAGAVPGQATALATNLYGFEIMVGPYAVTELRLSRALRDRGATLPADGTHVYLTDTLEGPHAKPPALPSFFQPISEQHIKALRVKNQVPVIVCVGNPPYDRHEAAAADNKTRTGNWVRWGDHEDGKDAILRDFVDPVVEAGHGVHVKNLYNLYVYFWRWALWKVFEHETAAGPGVVSFISASSYLDGDAFSGMREHLRRLCDDVWIIDLGGEGRGTRKEENVFAIQTPVAIAIAVRAGKLKKDDPARVHYARIEGTREGKLLALNDLVGFESLEWTDCSNDWRASFLPTGKGTYFALPLLTDLLPWQHSGCEVKRTWPICHDQKTLAARWKALMLATDRAALFRETRDRKVKMQYSVLKRDALKPPPIAALPKDAPVPPIERYAYRSFDRQWLILDNRVGDYLRPDLRDAHGPNQIYITSLFNHPLGSGPALTACSDVSDRHHFRGSFGGKDVMPLYRDAAGKVANLLPALLDTLGKAYKRRVAPEDFFAYLYGTLAQPAFTTRFAKELATRELRVPITKDPALFAKLRDVGARLLWLHTFGNRFVPKGEVHGHIPPGAAKCITSIPDDRDGYPTSFEYTGATRTLKVGKGEFRPVSPEVFEFEVSGHKVLQSWLKYRMRDGAGKKSSPLDDIRPERWTSETTTELLELLWILQATVEGYAEQARLLDAAVGGDCFVANELPAVPAKARKPPDTGPANREF